MAAAWVAGRSWGQGSIRLWIAVGQDAGDRRRLVTAVFDPTAAESVMLIHTGGRYASIPDMRPLERQHHVHTH